MIVCQKRVSGDYAVRKVDIEESGLSKSSVQHHVEREFKEDLGSFLTARVHHDQIKDHIFAGVYVVLKAAEDFEGPALVVFKAQLPTFERLRKVYARRDLSGLRSDKGCYNWGLALDAAAEMDKAELDENDFRFKG